MTRFLKYSLACAALLLVAVSASAQIAPLQGTNLGIPETGSLRDYIIGIVNVALTLVGVAAAIYLILSGVRYITSAGDEGDTKKAKNGIIYAVLGLIVIGLAALIVNFIISAF